MLYALLSLAAATCTGAADFLAGVKARSLSRLSVALLVQAGGLLVIIPAVALGGFAPDRTVVAAAMAAAICTALALPALYGALAIGPVTVVATIVSASAAIPAAVGFTIGGTPSLVTILGTAVIGAGVVAACAESDDIPGERIESRRGILLAIAAAMLIGLAQAVVGVSSTSSNVLSLVALTRIITAAILLSTIVLVLRRRITPSSGPPLGILTVGALDGTSFLLYALATANGPLSTVAVLTSLYPIVTVLLAHLVLDERVRAIQYAGAGLAILGIVLIGSG